MKINLKPNKISDDGLQKLADILKLIGEFNRLKIVMLCLESSVCVGDIVTQTELSQSLVSHHLRLLRTMKIVKTERKGKSVYYSIYDDLVRCVLVDMIDHVLKT